MSSVMNFMSTMAASTTWARFSAPSGLRLGASRDGERTRPASIAASATRELLRRLAEIALRRRLDAVGAGAEIDAVEIELEDLRLAELALQPERQRRAPAPCGSSVRSCVRNRFLASCWVSVEPPCDTPRRSDVGDDGAGDADRVDAVVRIEAAVLDRDEGLRHVARQVLQRHGGAAHVAARGQRLALQIDDLDRRRALGDFERLDRRQMRADPDRRRR